MKNKGAWIGAGALVLSAIIGAAYNYFPIHKQQTSPSIVQNNDSGANNNAGRDINQPGRDAIHAGHDVTINNNVYGDTSKHRKPVVTGGTIYNITSNGQIGGITAAKVWVLNNATIITPEKQENEKDLPQNYSCTIDTVNNLIKIQPKSGRWNTPFIGFPHTEKGVINPHLKPESNKSINISSGAFHIGPDSLFGLTTNGVPATKQEFYSLHYDELPTKIIFGNYPQPLYQAILRNK